MEKQDIYYLRVIRVISSLAIVVLHTFSHFITSFEATSAQRIFCFSVRNLQMFAVPCFVMVTGVLLLRPEKEITIGQVFRKYIKRIVTALLVFSLLFALYDFILSKEAFSWKVFSSWLLTIYQNKSWSHLWYLYMILAIYLLLPVYRLVSKGAGIREYRYLLLVYFLFQIILSTADMVSGVKTGFYICVYTVYPFYLFLGHGLDNQAVKIPLWLSAVLFVVGLVGIPLLTYFQFILPSDVAGKLTGNYSSIVVVAFSTGVFSLLSRIKRTKDKSNIFSHFILTLDHVSFGVYLVHMIGIKLFTSFVKWNPYSLGTITGCLVVLVVSVGIYLFSGLLVFVGKRLAHAVHLSST